MPPVSLYESMFSEGDDTICVMDQVKDVKNTDESWLEHIALKEAMSRLTDRERWILNLRFLKEKHRWRFPQKLAFLKHRFRGWKRLL